DTRVSCAAADDRAADRYAGDLNAGAGEDASRAFAAAAAEVVADHHHAHVARAGERAAVQDARSTDERPADGQAGELAAAADEARLRARAADDAVADLDCAHVAAALDLARFRCAAADQRAADGDAGNLAGGRADGAGEHAATARHVAADLDR